MGDGNPGAFGLDPVVFGEEWAETGRGPRAARRNPAPEDVARTSGLALGPCRKHGRGAAVALVVEAAESVAHE